MSEQARAAGLRQHARARSSSGRDFASRPDYSEETARQIDAEVRGIVMGCYERAKKLLHENIDDPEAHRRRADRVRDPRRRRRRDPAVQGGTITRERPKPRVNAPPRTKEKEKRRILEGIQPLPALEPNKA